MSSEQADMAANRYQRQFLRLLRAFREMRRTIGAVIMTGGQLNVAKRIQQVNVTPEDDQRTRLRRRGTLVRNGAWAATFASA